MPDRSGVWFESYQSGHIIQRRAKSVDESSVRHLWGVVRGYM
jgi:hypothetical protein